MEKLTVDLTERNRDEGLQVVRVLTFMIIGLWLTGCVSVPFEEPTMQALDEDVSPRQMVSDYVDRLAPLQVAEKNLVFRLSLFFGLYRQEHAVLGYARINREAGTFAITALTPLGLQLFHLDGDLDQVERRYAIAEFADRPEFLEAVAEAIRIIYFDLSPEPDAQFRLRRDRVVFSEPAEKGRIEYVFGGPKMALLQKRWRRWWGSPWRVSYYEYADKNGMLVPRGVALQRRRGLLRYRVYLRIRDVSFDRKEHNQ